MTPEYLVGYGVYKAVGLFEVLITHNTKEISGEKRPKTNGEDLQCVLNVHMPEILLNIQKDTTRRIEQEKGAICNENTAEDGLLDDDDEEEHEKKKKSNTQGLLQQQRKRWMGRNVHGHEKKKWTKKRGGFIEKEEDERKTTVKGREWNNIHRRHGLFYRFFCFLEKIPSSILFIPVFLRASRQLEPPI
ncbi:hypothetical protein OUZ56_003986 [Daphnia magna]|uniref:Uncharacterized protein n=1 Tax=Daphnia magna TaxID=35525 RepID=A0ABQ9YNE6_9CRUS|nr:hypothetical protein OUZ56_003986 [Daphnia magna]